MVDQPSKAEPVSVALRALNERLERILPALTMHQPNTKGPAHARAARAVAAVPAEAGPIRYELARLHRAVGALGGIFGENDGRADGEALRRITEAQMRSEVQHASAKAAARAPTLGDGGRTL